jgi:uncharacterized protein YecT (DUF1311 family)
MHTGSKPVSAARAEARGSGRGTQDGRFERRSWLMRKIPFAIVLALAFSGSAEAKRTHDLATPVPNLYRTEFDDEDARMKTAYEMLMFQLGPAETTSLGASQRRWIQSKNRACGFGTTRGCALRLTVARANALERMVTRQKAWRHWPDSRLMQLNATLDSGCDGYGQELDGPICRRRDETTLMLGRRGWCWGPVDAAESQRHWMRLCKP